MKLDKTIYLSLIAVVFITASMNVFCQTSEIVILPTDLPTLENIKKIDFKKADQTDESLKALIRMEGQHYASELPDLEHLNNSLLLQARLESHSSFDNTPRLSVNTDLAGGTFFYKNQSHYILYEAFADFSFNRIKEKDLAVYFGRKKMEWSYLDTAWQLSLWQPRFAIDQLRPQTLGLTGLFFDVNQKDFGMSLFATPLFIPSMGPDIREEDGSLVSDSRWYRSPSSKFNFMNSKDNPIRYSLDIPSQRRLIDNWGSALRFRVGSLEQGPVALVAVGNKPINELTLKRKINVDTSNQAYVTVSPEVTRHQIYSMDIGYRFEKLSIFGSILEDHPEFILPAQGWAIQNLHSMRIFSASLSYSIKNNLFSGDLFFSHMKVIDGNIEDVTSNGEVDDKTLFDQRMRFTKASLVKYSGEIIQIKKMPLVGQVSYMYEHDQKGQLIGSELNLKVSSKATVLVGADILGVDNEESSKETSFLNQFRANDRIYGGMTYVF